MSGLRIILQTVMQLDHMPVRFFMSDSVQAAARKVHRPVVGKEFAGEADYD